MRFDPQYDKAYGARFRLMASNAVHFPEELVALIDAAMQIKGGYSSRAEFIREVVRSKAHQIIDANTQQQNPKGTKYGKWP